MAFLHQAGIRVIVVLTTWEGIITSPGVRFLHENVWTQVLDLLVALVLFMVTYAPANWVLTGLLVPVVFFGEALSRTERFLRQTGCALVLIPLSMGAYLAGTWCCERLGVGVACDSMLGAFLAGVTLGVVRSGVWLFDLSEARRHRDADLG